MTTPRPDEPLTVAEMHRLTEHLSPYDLALFSRAIAASHTAGRDQGLRESSAACEVKARGFERTAENTDIDAYLAKASAARSCAAAIEQLRGE